MKKVWMAFVVLGVSSPLWAQRGAIERTQAADDKQAAQCTSSSTRR